MHWGNKEYIQNFKEMSSKNVHEFNWLRIGPSAEML
jgi:hypothetical protein